MGIEFKSGKQRVEKGWLRVAGMNVIMMGL
jgi:hypothetical protein